MSPDQPATVVIPARYGSSRFPGKPLIQLAGRPLIEHIYRQASRAKGVGLVVVATDDPRIVQAVKQFGGEVVLTEGSFRTGTDRVAAVARHLAGDVIINLQGDEIPLHDDFLLDLLEQFRGSGADIGTLKRRITSKDEIFHTGAVKVVTDYRGTALYFSRAPIPHRRDLEPDVVGMTAVQPELHYLHLGVYIYTRAALMQFADLPTGRLEDAEKLEQLRALEHGFSIRVWETSHPSLRIDAPEDVAGAEAVLVKMQQEGSLSPR